MTVDRVQRKQAKRNWKKHAQAGKEGVPKRERKKKSTARRLCQGMCYKDPALSEADKKWSGNADSDDDDVGASGEPAYDSDIEEAQQRLASHKEASPSHTSDAAQKADRSKMEKKKNKKKKPEVKPAIGLVKLSTGIQLLDPSKALQSVKGKGGSDEAIGQNGDAGQQAGNAIEAVALKPFPTFIQSFMVSQGYIEPTPIQEQCWPLCCQGHDVLGVAEPGSGKTLAYLLPGFLALQAAGHGGSTSPDSPLMLVLAPTRELAQQVAGQCRQARKLAGLRTVCLYGGVPKEPQVELLDKKPHVLVATPGRLLDLLDDGATSLSRVRFIVLDEADRMLSLGFKQQLDRLHSLLLPHKQGKAITTTTTTTSKPKKQAKKEQQQQQQQQQEAAAGSRPQVLLFTATMPDEVQQAAGAWLTAAREVRVSHSAASISKTITQVVQVCAEHKKPAKLLKHLAAIQEKSKGLRNPPRILVFANRIKTVRFLHETLSKEGHRVVMLHGARSQAEREAAVRELRAGKCQVMIATDIAARGLDIRALPYVVNYDFPTRLETYIHRVGRTGRLAAYGHAFSFFTRNLAKLAGPLVDLLNAHSQTVDPNLLQLATAWREAVARVGGEEALERHMKKQKGSSGGSDEEGSDADEGDDVEEEQDLFDARAGADDLEEGLRATSELRQLMAVGSPAGKKKNKRKDRGKGDGDEEGGEEQQQGKKVKGSSEAGAAGKEFRGPGFQQRLKEEKAKGVAVAKAKEEENGRKLAFMASAKFAGARPGYVFKMGALGLGYYKDQAPAVKKKGGAVNPSLVQKGKGSIIPIGPQGAKKASWSDSESDDDAPPPPAAGAARAQAKQGGGGGKQNGGGVGKQRRKAVPGRLRKKLKAQGRA